jgi:MFS family permease
MSITRSRSAGSVAAASPRVLPRPTAFWLVAGMLALLLFAAGAPSPLYAVYAARWHFSATTLTAVFAVYAIALLVALLVLGSLSDHLGRRPVIMAALLIDAAAMVLFLLANGVGLLYAARALQGVATGAATSALSASLIELQPDSPVPLGPLVNSAAPTLGLAAGALGTSALVQYGPAPIRLIYWLLLAALILAAVAMLGIPEPGTRRAGALASLRPQAGVPRQARAMFAIALPSLVALWALGGLYLSLGPSIAAQLLSSHNLLWGGLVIFLLTGTGAIAAILLRGATPTNAMLAGCLTLLAGVGITLSGIATSTAALFLIGTTVAGFGFGVAFLGAFRTLSALAAPDERAALIATIYIVSYLAFSVPVVIAGVAATSAGLHNTSTVYAAVLAALVAGASVSLLIRRRSAHRATRTTPAQPGLDLPPGPCTVPHCAHHPDGGPDV